MATKSLPGILLALITAAAIIPAALALEASPNSPCAPLCVDSRGLNQSDPSSFSTVGADIKCTDEDIQTTAQGEKFQQCVGCLQGSTYSGGGQNDQAWFVYNLQYSVDYCVFGYPNASGAVSGPCVTSEACGPLADTLRAGILHPDSTEPYNYCGGEASALAGEIFQQCLGCIQAEESTAYLANYLIALQAGCQQQPSSGVMLGLNETVFSATTVQIVDPTPTASAGSDARDTNTRAIHGVLFAIAGLVALLLAAGCAYMQVRRRRNRSRRAARAQQVRRTLLFRDQPRSPPPRGERGVDVDAKSLASSSSSLGEKPAANPVEMMHSSAVPWGAASNPRTNAIKLSNLTTVLPRPQPVQAASPHRNSPDDYFTPQSTTSLRSSIAPLISGDHRPYNPAEWTGSTPPQNSIPTFTPAIAVTSPEKFVASFIPGLAISTTDGMPSPRVYPISGFQPGRTGSPSSPWEQQRTTGSARDLARPYGSGEGMGRAPVSFVPPPRW